MLSNPEIKTLTEMLLSGYRLDGRSLIEYREISFRFPQDKGSDHSGCCVVKIGATSVMAQVSTEVVEPKHFRPSQGMLFVNFDASLLHFHKNIQKHKGDDEGRRLSAVLQTLLRDSVDLDALCVVAWERVFAIRVDLRALSYDGNFGDCGALAAVAALAAFRRPDVFVDDSGKVIVDYEAQYRPRIPLSIRRIPVLVTIGLSVDAKIILIDPSAREEKILLGGRVMLGLTSFSEICCLYTTGLTVPVQSSSLSRCIRLANSKAQSLVALINQLVEGLALQRHATISAAHARSTELNKVLSLSANAPLILSTISYISGGVDKFESLKKNIQIEGEISPNVMNLLTDSDSDMEIDSSDGELHVPDLQAESLKSKLLPYGVIEVSSTMPNISEFENLQSIDFLDAFSSMKYPTTLELASDNFTDKSGGSLVQKSCIKIDDDEEELVTVVKIT